MKQFFKKVGVGLVGILCIVSILTLFVLLVLGIPSVLYHVNPLYAEFYYSVIGVLFLIGMAHYLGSAYYGE
jgi:hypothetical protein